MTTKTVELQEVAQTFAGKEREKLTAAGAVCAGCGKPFQLGERRYLAINPPTGPRERHCQGCNECYGSYGEKP